MHTVVLNPPAWVQFSRPKTDDTISNISAMFQNLLCDFIVEDPLRPKIASIDLKDNDITLKVSFVAPDAEDVLDNYIYTWAKFPQEVAEFSLLRIDTEPTGKYAIQSMLLSRLVPVYGPFPPSERSAKRRMYTFKGHVNQGEAVATLAQNFLNTLRQEA